MEYFVDSFDTQNRRAVLSWAREEYDSGDPWGWVMSWLFDIAGELDRRGKEVPSALGYRPGACGPYVSEDRAKGLALFSAEALEHAAIVLNRFDILCRKKGLDY